MDTKPTDDVNAEAVQEEQAAQAVPNDTAAEVQDAEVAEQQGEQLDDAEKVDLSKDVPESERIAHHSKEEAAAARESLGDGETDIFAWANNMFQHKDELNVELFLINKNNVIYRTKLNEDIRKQMHPLFINGMLEHLMNGAGTGMITRQFEEAEAEDGVLQYTKWENILRLTEVMHWMHTQESQMEFFKEDEHDIKRIKGALARCSHPSLKDPFYVIKVLPSAQVFKGEGAWIAQGDKFVPFEAPAFRIPGDNQMLVIGPDIFVFNQAKLERMFGYNAKKNSIAEKKVEEIEEHYKLSFAEGMDMQSLVKGNKPTINKLQNIEVDGSIKQDDIIDHAENLGMSLLVDEDGAIIIENTKDLTTFVNLLNDDYVESPLTGQRYEIQRKKLLKPPKDDEPGA